jgi:hypothetical protein
LYSLKSIVKLLNKGKNINKYIYLKEENKTHMLPVIIAATDDKSWQVRLALSKNFADLTEAFGKEITDSSLV